MSTIIHADAGGRVPGGGSGTIGKAKERRRRKVAATRSCVSPDGQREKLSGTARRSLIPRSGCLLVPRGNTRLRRLFRPLQKCLSSPRYPPQTKRNSPWPG